jgi:hypothetical protein
VAVSVWPCCADPLIVGGAVFAGIVATVVGGVVVSTGEVAADVATVDPDGLDAVTATRIVPPASLDTRT